MRWEQEARTCEGGDERSEERNGLYLKIRTVENDDAQLFAQTHLTRVGEVPREPVRGTQPIKYLSLDRSPFAWDEVSPLTMPFQYYPRILESLLHADLPPEVNHEVDAW